jgi:uncharacterized protein
MRRTSSRARPWYGGGPERSCGSILAAVHFDQLTGPEQRVLGCLIEKRWTTPEQYPLSLNALRLACNQATNRDPVTAYDEMTVTHAAQRLSRYGLARLASGHGSRATKYRHLAEEALGLSRPPLAILCVLLLRGAQTPGELKGRSERMAQLESLADVERVLADLVQRGYTRRIERRPGQKEERFEQLLGSAAGPVSAALDSSPNAPPSIRSTPVAYEDLAARVAALEQEVARLGSALAVPPPGTALAGPAQMRFEQARVDAEAGGELAQAMRVEIAEMYDGIELDGDYMPRAGPAELSPPGGTFIVGSIDGRPVCCGGIKRLEDRICEIKKMYVVPSLRGRGLARRLLHELEAQARELGYEVARLDTGPRQVGARGLYESEGYAEVNDFNGNPVASFWGEKPLV